MEERKADSQDNSESLTNGAKTQEGEQQEQDKTNIAEEAKIGMIGLEEEKVVGEVERIKRLVGETGVAKKPSKKLSEMVLKISKSPEPFVHTPKVEDKALMKFIDNTPFSNSLQTIDKGRKNPSQLKAYKNFFVSLFESVLVMKQIQPLSEADLETRILSIPRPAELKCTCITTT